MPHSYTPDRDLSWHGVAYPAGLPAQIPDDLAAALGLTGSPDADPQAEAYAIDTGSLEAELEAIADRDKAALSNAVDRLEELRLIYQVDGWQAIKAIGDPLGVKKHPDGWDSSLLLIIEQEFSPAIAAELADE